MPTFTYRIKDAQGKTIRDQIIAKDSNDALLNLRQKGLVVISIDEVKKREILSRNRGKRVKLKQLAQFSRQLSTLVGAGIPLVRDLRVLANQVEDKTLRQVTDSICKHIEAGTSLSEALANYPAIFGPLYISMVNAGEASGALNEILERLADYLEKTDALIRRTISILIYPTAIVTIGLLISAFLILVVIPRFKEIFSMIHAGLPFITRVFVGVSDLSKKYFLVFLGLIAFLVFLVYGYIKTQGGRIRFDRFKLRMPLFGVLFQKIAIARFSRTLATLLKSGVPILNSLDIVGKTAGNKVIENAIVKIRRGVSQGQRLATQMWEEPLFPQIVTEMVAVGEESGELEPMLTKIADSYEEEVASTINGLLSVLEPIIIIFLGLIVGTIVLAMFLPILKVTQLLGGV